MKVMKLVDQSSGMMECRVCGSVHWASIKPKSNGRFYPGSWQCSNESCPSNEKVWNEQTHRYVKAGFHSR
jgi:hypothetical protein